MVLSFRQQAGPRYDEATAQQQSKDIKEDKRLSAALPIAAYFNQRCAGQRSSAVHTFAWAQVNLKMFPSICRGQKAHLKAHQSVTRDLASSNYVNRVMKRSSTNSSSKQWHMSATCKTHAARAHDAYGLRRMIFSCHSKTALPGGLPNTQFRVAPMIDPSQALSSAACTRMPGSTQGMSTYTCPSCVLYTADSADLQEGRACCGKSR